MNDTKLANILEELKSREPIFHHLKVGATSSEIENMMAPGFWEVGASGNRYEREDILDTVVLRYKDELFAKNDIWETKDFECREIASDNYLLTYMLIQGKEKQITRRATIWQRIGNEWKIYYHQGTLVKFEKNINES